MDAACAALVEAGWLISTERTGEAHRPAKAYLVNSAIYEGTL
jgi:hypothetical protein